MTLNLPLDLQYLIWTMKCINSNEEPNTNYMDLLSCTILKATYNIYHEDACYLLRWSPTKNDWDDAHVWTLVDVSHPPFGPPTV